MSSDGSISGFTDGRRIMPDDRLGPETRLTHAPATLSIGRLARPCVRSLRVPVRATVARPDSLRTIHIRLDGRLIRRTHATALTVRVPANKLRAGRHRLTVAAQTETGWVTTTRNFTTC